MAHKTPDAEVHLNPDLYTFLEEVAEKKGIPLTEFLQSILESHANVLGYRRRVVIRKNGKTSETVPPVLEPKPEPDERPLKEQVLELIAKNGPMTVVKLATELGKNRTTVRSCLYGLEKKDLVSQYRDEKGTGPIFWGKP